MAQFASCAVAPRKIAWLLAPGDWVHLESVIKRNCVLVGGYFNVLVPPEATGVPSAEYVAFVRDYDPDLVILPPGMSVEAAKDACTGVYPFAWVPWAAADDVVPLDPGFRREALGAAPDPGALGSPSSPGWTRVAFRDPARPDASRLALLACGDANGSGDEASWSGLLGHSVLMHAVYSLADAQGTSRGAPDPSSETVSGSSPIYFPLSGTVAMLDATLDLRRFPTRGSSLIGFTADYLRISRTLLPPPGGPGGLPVPDLCLLVSDYLDVENAALFWNLRACGIGVVWLPFGDVEARPDDVAAWLTTVAEDPFRWLGVPGRTLRAGLAADAGSLARLTGVLGRIEASMLERAAGTRPLPVSVAAAPSEKLARYVGWPLALWQEHVLVAGDGSDCAFVPRFARTGYGGVRVATLQWHDCMLPRSPAVTRECVALRTVGDLVPWAVGPGGARDAALAVPQFRVGSERYLRVQVTSESPVEFHRPTPAEVFAALFRDAGYADLKESSAAGYQRAFIGRVGGLASAAQYLGNEPTRGLLRLLADRRDRTMLGWILEPPDQRRALHHLHLRQALGCATEACTTAYFARDCDALPEVAAVMLAQGVLERGVLLRCEKCGYKSWYPVAAISDTFTCGRCYSTQVYGTNPPWLYKLPEVVYQGLAEDMHVPLLALEHLRGRSPGSFQFAYDSDVYWSSGKKTLHRNVDLLAIVDGLALIGEVKSCDAIDADQFAFYEGLSRRVDLDGIVFATSASAWCGATREGIELLQRSSGREVISLVGEDLYRPWQS